MNLLYRHSNTINYTGIYLTHAVKDEAKIFYAIAIPRRSMAGQLPSSRPTVQSSIRSCKYKSIGKSSQYLTIMIKKTVVKNLCDYNINNKTNKKQWSLL